MAPNTIRAIRATPPRTPPTMAPVGVDGAAVATGSIEVAAPAAAESVADAVARGASVLTDEVSVEVDDDSDDDEVEVEVETELEDEEDLVDALDDVVFLVDVGLGLIVDMVLLLSRLWVVSAVSTDVCLFVMQ